MGIMLAILLSLPQSDPSSEFTPCDHVPYWLMLVILMFIFILGPTSKWVKRMEQVSVHDAITIVLIIKEDKSWFGLSMVKCTIKIIYAFNANRCWLCPIRTLPLILYYEFIFGQKAWLGFATLPERNEFTHVYIPASKPMPLSSGGKKLIYFSLPLVKTFPSSITLFRYRCLHQALPEVERQVF